MQNYSYSNFFTVVVLEYIFQYQYSYSEVEYSTPSLPPPRQFLCNKIHLKKLATVREMLIEQIVELRRPGPSGCTCTPIIGCFHDKTVIFKENIRLNCYLLLKYCRRQCTLLPPPGPNHLQNLTPKCKIFNVFWTRIASKRRTEQLNFFNWLSNVKNLVFSNGSEYVRMFNVV